MSQSPTYEDLFESMCEAVTQSGEVWRSAMEEYRISHTKVAEAVNLLTAQYDRIVAKAKDVERRTLKEMAEHYEQELSKTPEGRLLMSEVNRIIPEEPGCGKDLSRRTTQQVEEEEESSPPEA